MVHRTLLRALASCIACAALTVAAPVSAATVHQDSPSTDAPVVEPQNGPHVDPDG